MEHELAREGMMMVAASKQNGFPITVLNERAEFFFKLSVCVVN